MRLRPQGAGIPHGGSSQPKLLGGYKLLINGVVVGTGPGRLVNQTQGVDALDVTSVLNPGANAVGIQGFHTSRFHGFDPRLLFLLRLHFTDGTMQDIASGAECQAFDADAFFGPDSGTGAWAGGKCSGASCSGMPQENLQLQHFQRGWASPGFKPGSGWSAAAVATPFVLPLGNRPARPIQVLARRAAKVTPYSGCLSDTGRDPEGGCVPCKDCYLIDYGRNLQGGVNLSFTCDAKAGCADGHQVTILLSEELISGNSSLGPLVPMSTGNNFTALWTLAPGTFEGLMQHEYEEFRYALVANAPHPMTVANTGAWVLRGMSSDDPSDQYDDAPTLPASALRRSTAVASFSTDSQPLNEVWSLVRHTLVACAGLDIDVDSNTRQRDFCATDAYITGLGQLAISSDYGVAGMTAINGFMVDSNIWQGMTDFRSALISLAHSHALCKSRVDAVAIFGGLSAALARRHRRPLARPPALR